jgi:hypothetical protein
MRKEEILNRAVASKLHVGDMVTFIGHRSVTTLTPGKQYEVLWINPRGYVKVTNDKHRKNIYSAGFFEPPGQAAVVSVLRVY